MTGIVLVSHSLPLAQAALELVRGLVPGLEVPVELAAGLEGGELGTDALAVAEAVARADDGGGALVLADLGSGVLSALTALELLDPELAPRVRLSPAPLVEGLVGAYAAAGTGRSLEEVAQEAETAVEAKRQQVLGG
ncbi:dihydroxyacetone kinase phosphoryl donor subunit DhaM [Actinomyces trachealis]|uniref:dihydroxyacetone kinase phosphoryl donor subunit DhaM n=1 Tax=Actinomyces trachealis TaxID=2763540 RepID=UPI001892AC3F|nr:dihydroxyacetone kinase phosphoryl donor subunit DhaM [Actinomyces trachealis]